MKNKQSSLYLITKKHYGAWLKKQSEYTKHYLESLDFQVEEKAYVVLADEDGVLRSVLAILPNKPDIWAIAHLYGKIPPHDYVLESEFTHEINQEILLGYELAKYKFTKYKTNGKDSGRAFANISCKEVDGDYISALKDAVYLVRDMVNTPASDMMPADISKQAQLIAKQHGAKFNEIVGDDLLKENYPTIHMVGRASVNQPRLIELNWGKKNHPAVVLIGKGVCFDSGGLDIKSSSNMLLMKKDMAGAAHALALAMLIMQCKLPVNLRVLIPAVENSVSGNAFRPLDVVKSRKGITIEVGNTDAEGRLILCDALADADTKKPELVIDFATLTGAARVALGTDIAAYFTNSDKLSVEIMKYSTKCSDPMWRLPLWQGYRDDLDSDVADINNAGSSGYAGAITAALFLKEFVSEAKEWLHVDMMAWNTKSRSGRPKGGEAMSIRTLYALLSARYNNSK